MARGVGLDAGAFEVKVVELDGSYRKPRLAKVSIDRVPATPAGDGALRVEAEAALAAVKDQHIKLDSLMLGFPCREAVLRSLKIPFVGDDAIRKVIKFEAEGTIHSHSVDDMVVDFMTIERGEGESQVLVAAVPKKSLGALLDALEHEGIEPERVDLDTMALYRAADWAGCFGDGDKQAANAVEDAKAAGSATPAIPSRRARVVIDVGARSTRALAVVDGKLVDMRAMRVGAESIADEIAAELGVPTERVHDPVATALETGEDFVIEFDGAPPPEGEEGAESVPVPSRVVDHRTTEAARARFVQRLGRELLRFLTALPRIAGVERVIVTGGASLIPGVREVIGETFGCEVVDLDLLTKLNHDLGAEDAARIGPRIAVAVGLALGMLGAPVGMDFRRENLAYKRRFDRIKFPLAIAAMLAVFLPFIYATRIRAQVTEYEKQYGMTYQFSEESGRRPKAVFFGFVSRMLSPSGDKRLERYMGAKDFDALVRDVAQRPTFQRLPKIREELEKNLKRKQAETNIYEDLQLPSGIYVLSDFAQTLQSIERDLGEFLVVSIDLSMPSTKNSKYMEVLFAFRGDNYRVRFERMKSAFEASFTKTGSPFSDFKTGGNVQGEKVFADSDTPGAYYTLRFEIRDDFSVSRG
ncbi:MAG: pilus assembly protein PilM [Planctomycetota bacterium]